MQLIFPVLPDRLASGQLAQSFFPDADDIRGMQFAAQTIQGLELRGFDVEGCRFSGCRPEGGKLLPGDDPTLDPIDAPRKKRM